MGDIRQQLNILTLKLTCYKQEKWASVRICATLPNNTSRWINNWVSSTTKFVGCTRSAVIRTYQKWAKETPGCTMGKKLSRRRWYNVLLGNFGSWKVIWTWLTSTTYLNIIADQAHPKYMETIFPVGRGLFQQDNAPCPLQKWLKYCSQQQAQGEDLASKFSRTRSSGASLGYAAKKRRIHGGLTSYLTGLKASATNRLLLHTTAYRAKMLWPISVYLNFEL